MARHVFLLTYHESAYPSVAALTLVLSMPASEAYAEHVFNVCGLSVCWQEKQAVEEYAVSSVLTVIF